MLLLLSGSPWVVLAQEFTSGFIEAEKQRAIQSPDTRVNLSVDAPIQQVFDTLLKSVSQFSEDVSRVEFDNQASAVVGDIDIGSLRISHMEDGTQLIQRIIKFDPPFSFAYFTDLGASTVKVPLDYTIGHYELSAVNSQQTNAEVSVAYRTSSRLTGFVVRRVFNRAVRQDFKRAEALLNSSLKN